MCFEYTLPKFPGMTSSECIILALAIDYESGKKQSALLRNDIIEVGVEVREGAAGDVVRLLVVTREEKNEA